MKIVHAANFPHIRLKGCFLNSMPFKITNGLIRNGHQVIDYPDRDVLRAFGKLFGSKKANQNFIDYCLLVQPDAIILEHCDTIYAETLRKIRAKLPNVKIMQINVDAIDAVFADHNINNIKSKLAVVDWTLVTTADKKRLEVFGMEYQSKIGFIPNPVDASIEIGRAFEHETLKYDLNCIAKPTVTRQFCGKSEMMADIIERISKNIKTDKVLFSSVSGGSLDGADYQQTLSNCAIGINLSRMNEDYLYTSDRLAHLMGNGVLALIDVRTGYRDIFSDDEAAFYETEEDFFKLLNFYLENPKERMKVAENGWKKYHRLFNERVLAKYVSDLLFGGFKASDYPFPTIGGQ